MSIATQIEALQNDKTAIRNAILDKGGTSGEAHGFDDFATDIASMPSGITPSGSLSISANGTYDVTNYASANVNVVSQHGYKKWTVTVSSKQTSSIKLVQGDSDVASKYNSDTLVIKISKTGGFSDLTEHDVYTMTGMNTIMGAIISGTETYQLGVYRSSSAMSMFYSAAKLKNSGASSITATNAGNIIFEANVHRDIPAGTFDVEMWW